MFIAMCLIVILAICALAQQVFFGRLMGLFAIKSFASSCHYQQQNSNISNVNNYICPLGVEPNPFNYPQLHK